MTDKHRKAVYVISAILFLLIIGAIGWFVGVPMVRMAREPEQFRQWVDSFGIWSRLIFLAIVVFQVLIAFIPGEPIELAAGYIFGFWEGSLLTMLGFLIGSWLIFDLVRKFGVRLVEVFFTKGQIEENRFFEKPEEDKSACLHSDDHSWNPKGFSKLFCRPDPTEPERMALHRSGIPVSFPDHIHSFRCFGRKGELFVFPGYVCSDGIA